MNCRPPLKPLPVSASQLPVLSQCASFSQVAERSTDGADGADEVDSAAEAVPAPTCGA